SLCLVERNEHPLTRLTKLAGSVVFYGGSTALRAIQRLLGRKPPGRLVVINYHHVFDDEREQFKQQLAHLLRWTHPISTDFNDPLIADTIYSALTEDDGWSSFARNAAPEIIRRKVALTIFAISDMLGESIDDIDEDRIMSENELRELAAQNVEIG